MQKMIWVVGPPRSGTTWVGKELARRLSYQYVHEPFHPGNQPSWSPVTLQYHTDIKKKSNLSNYLKSRINNRGRYLWWRLQRGTFRDRLYYLKQYLDSNRKKGKVVKDPHLSLLSHQLLSIFPNSIAVWVHRNKRDHLTSLERKGWKYDIKKLVENKFEFISSEQWTELKDRIDHTESQRELNATGYDLFQEYRKYHFSGMGERLFVVDYDQIKSNGEELLEAEIRKIRGLIANLH